jgi:hypothetical protein
MKKAACTCTNVHVWIRKGVQLLYCTSVELMLGVLKSFRIGVLIWAGIFKLLWSPGIDSTESIPPACSPAGRYENPIPTRFLASIDYLKIPALASHLIDEMPAS